MLQHHIYQQEKKRWEHMPICNNLQHESYIYLSTRIFCIITFDIPWVYSEWSRKFLQREENLSCNTHTKKNRGRMHGHNNKKCKAIHLEKKCISWPFLWIWIRSPSNLHSMTTSFPWSCKAREIKDLTKNLVTIQEFIVIEKLSYKKKKVTEYTFFHALAALATLKASWGRTAFPTSISCKQKCL